MQPSLSPKKIPSPLPALWLGLCSLAMLTVLFHTVDWDQRLAAYYWNQGLNPWPGRSAFWGSLAYRWGQAPAFITGILGGLAFLLSYRLPKWRRFRGPGLFLFLLLLLGPGLLVNGLGKALAGRPRPSQVMDFGGAWPFARPWHFGIPGKGTSFPSGHASMAFYWLGLYFLARRRGLRLLGAATGLALGAWMSWTRVSQGGHFLSDTLFSGAFMFCLAAALSPLIHWQPEPRFWAQRKVWSSLLLGLAGYALIAQVVFEERQLLWTADPQLQATQDIQRLQLWQGAAPLDKVALDLDIQQGDIEASFLASQGPGLLPLQISEEFRGQGLPGAKESLEAAPLGPSALFLQGPGTLGTRVTQALRGLWWDRRGHYAVSLPQGLAVDARLKSAHGVLTIGPFPPGRQVLLNGDLHQENLPQGFKPFGSQAWLLDGAQPQIALTLAAPEIHFRP